MAVELTPDIHLAEPAAAEGRPLHRRAQSQGPVLLVLVGAVALWLYSGVSPGQVAAFLGYHVLYVLAPGWLLYRLLRPADGFRFRQLVLGWALGYVLEVLAFAGTAAAGARGVLTAYPLAVALLAAGLWRRRVSSHNGAPSEAWTLPPGWGWVMAALCLVALAFLGVEYFGSAPLPNQISRASYGIDTVWYLSIAGEALHHWPVSDPTVSGQPLFYHLFSSFDPAAVSQVTKLGLPVVFFRLYMVPLVLLAVLGLSLAGLTFSTAWAGPIAVALVLGVGELNVDPHVGYRFANELGDDVLAISPSFLFGTALLAPVLAVLCELAERWRSRRLPLGTLAVFALLMVGAAGGKATVAPVIGGGLALYLGWVAVRRRALHRPLLAGLAVIALVFVGFWLISYGGAGSDQLTFDPPGVIRQMETTSRIAGLLTPAGGWTALMWLALTLVGVVGAYGAQLAGLLAAPRQRLRTGGGMLLAVFAFAQLPYLLYTHPGLSQVFFSEDGVMAACLVSAAGVSELWCATGRRKLLATAAGACAATVLVALLLPRLLGLTATGAHSLFVYLDFALAVVLLVAFLLALLRRRPILARWGLVAAAALTVGFTGRILVVAAPTISQLAAGRPLYSQAGPGMTSGLYRALSWIRDHTSPSAVIAVNNFRDWSLYWSDGWAVPDDFNYSAFAERRVFLEGWIYTQAATEASNSAYDGSQLLFPRRVALNNEIFQWAHADALRWAAQHFGVRYLLVDRVHNRASPRLGRIARLVYADRQALVYAVPPTDLVPRG